MNVSSLAFPSHRRRGSPASLAWCRLGDRRPCGEKARARCGEGTDKEQGGGGTREPASRSGHGIGQRSLLRRSEPPGAADNDARALTATARQRL